MYQETDWFDVVFPNTQPNTVQVTKDGMVRDVRGIHKPDYLSSNGYMYTFLPMKDDLLVLQPFDRIMANTFIPVPKHLTGKDIIPHHINGDTSDCRVENLQWVEDIEEWRPIDFMNIHGEYYEISSHGNVRTTAKGSQRLMKQQIVDGYRRLCLVDNELNRKQYFVHRLVAKAFVSGWRADRDVVNHIDNMHDNNHYTNLEWVDVQQNYEHARMIGVTGLRGDANPASKITEENAATICISLNRNNGSIMKTYLELKDLIPELTYPIVSLIKYGNTFTYISDKLLTKAGRTKQERQTDPDVILKAAMLLKKYNGDVAKTKKEFEKEFPWVSLGWLWHLKDKSVAADITDQVFQKDEFPKTVPLTEETALMIIQSIVKHKNDQFITNEVLNELKDKIPGLTRDKVRSIKDGKAWATLSKPIFADAGLI